MSESTPRPGRPRRYDLQPVLGFMNETAAYSVSALEELSERLIDMISDLPQEALDYLPEGAGNSIAMLVVHMAWAEAFWISRVTGMPIPADLREHLLPGRQGSSGDLLPSSASLRELVTFCQRVRIEITMPALASLENVDLEIPDSTRPMTVRGVLMHLIWHWTYHSGQVGLLRRLWGQSRYQWTFSKRVGAPYK